MPDMTEEEYDALEELWTKNPPKVTGRVRFNLRHCEGLKKQLKSAILCSGNTYGRSS